MQVAVVGAGALGRVYGTRLANTGNDVAFVVRPSRIAETAPFVIERVSGDRDVLTEPNRVVAIPRGAQAVLVAVRFDQLVRAAGADGLTELLSAAPAVPIVVLTPLLPRERLQLENVISREVVPAMVGVAAYATEHDVIRYWLLPMQSTLIEDVESPARKAQREELARTMHRGRLPTRLERDVGEINAATTVTFFPLVVAIDAGGGVDAALADKELIELTLEAAKECDKLARRLGKPAAGAGVLMKFVGPFTLKAGVSLARRLSPESVSFVEHHFGPKLHEQHQAMGTAVLALGHEHGVPLTALERLLARARGRALADAPAQPAY